MKETIAGVPIGYSRDYDRLPLTEDLRDVRCNECFTIYQDALRQLEDGCRILAMRCQSCREERRAEWIADPRIDERDRALARVDRDQPTSELPQATAQYRRRTA